ncbi:alpha-1,2-fucosyltransferase [candidate division KSB1 bacterium]|nr:alpha-1,2-fucosyltransferase [candidate division KSB1 bacterium]
MVIVRLKGGLGNQLFQYALGRRIAHDSGIQLKFDIISGFKNDFYKRTYSLKYFNIQGVIASERELKRYSKLLLSKKATKLLKLLNRINPNPINIIKEENFNYDDKILKPYLEVYIDGYWQSEKYFKSIEKIIHKELQVSSPLEGYNKQIANKISKTNSVSVHIRRLHGISSEGNINAKGVNMHGANSLEYYYKAINYIQHKHQGIHIFVFSDDVDWVQNNLIQTQPTTFVNSDVADKDYEEMILMSLCKHNIIANSSFSWWGAWLNKNPDKVVIAPTNWFADNEMNKKTDDLIPENWIRL